MELCLLARRVDVSEGQDKASPISESKLAGVNFVGDYTTKIRQIRRECQTDLGHRLKRLTLMR